MVKSPSFTPLVLTGRWCLGRRGTLSGLYFEALPSLAEYTRKTEKSPVWRGHIQLSVSPPYLPTLLGGVPTKRTSLNFS